MLTYPNLYLKIRNKRILTLKHLIFFQNDFVCKERRKPKACVRDNWGALMIYWQGFFEVVELCRLGRPSEKKS